MPVPMWFPTAIGSAAAVGTTAAFVPQLLRVWRLKSAREISGTTFLVFSVGTALWLVYGFLIRSIPVIVANAITLGIALAILGLKLSYGAAARDPDRGSPDGR